MPKRPPYVEIIVTVVVMAFLVLIIIDGFNQSADDAGQVTMRAE